MGIAFDDHTRNSKVTCELSASQAGILVLELPSAHTLEVGNHHRSHRGETSSAATINVVSTIVESRP